ncbi:hypothetical protein F4561_004836 [Lipingzhangella halophila]|uniref:Transcription factor zinc-finger domain-containing protein n=2 Tax=Lipingzhangella halophila TaxID=1783352 RepID=A0A7W7RM66_9ACTN|nr:hypothetical protein [Lipingzhangella halophila]
MQTFDRQGVHIDRCGDCSGIFLDRGELEQLVDAEQKHNSAPPPDPEMRQQPQPQPQRPAYGGYRDSPRPYRSYPDSPKPYGSYPDSPKPYGQRRRKKSFLESLFD